MSRGWAKASACRLQITLSCAFLCHIVSLQYLSRSSLHRLAGLPCRLFLSYGLQVLTREVHRSSLRRLICPAQDHFIFLTVWIISMTFVLSLTQMLVFLSLYDCDVEHTSFHFGLCGRKFVLCLFGQCPGPVFMSRSQGAMTGHNTYGRTHGNNKLFMSKKSFVIYHCDRHNSRTKHTQV